ncbi:hypothetical protein BU17DRAFT_86983 [Hysterangium stoloniferum]|nr:hypothetical protein BU17DRAFT_86983 [Hysterangium stoloniferum]
MSRGTYQRDSYRRDIDRESPSYLERLPSIYSVHGDVFGQSSSPSPSKRRWSCPPPSSSECEHARDIYQQDSYQIDTGDCDSHSPSIEVGTPSRNDPPCIHIPSGSPFPISLDTREVSCPSIYYKLVRQLLLSYRDIYVVSSFGMFKEKKKKGKHEFVVAAVSPLGSESHQSLIFLVVERVPHAASIVGIHRTLCSPNHYVAAHDTIFALDHHNFYAFIQNRSAELLQYISFNTAPAGGHFLALDFLRIVASISEYKMNYSLTRTSCYWFAGTVMATIKECRFPVTHISGSTDAAGRYLGKKIFIRNPDEIRDLIKIYEIKRSEDVVFLESILGRRSD